MEFRYYAYWGFRNRSYLDRNDLPNEIRSNLLTGKGFEWTVAVDASKTDVVAALDRHCKIGKRHKYARELRVEVDRRDLDRYDYYFIWPRILEWPRNVFFDETPRSCPVEETCHWGIKRTSPVTVNGLTIQAYDIALITLSWSRKVELIISDRLKHLFEQEHVTGLSYERCLVLNGSISSKKQIHVATITGRGFPEHGDKAILGNRCQKHAMAHSAIVFGSRYLRRESSTTDFVVMDELQVKRRVWSYYVPRWVVSRRVLRLLLGLPAKGMRKVTFVCSEKFRPLVTDSVLIE